MSACARSVMSAAPCELGRGTSPPLRLGYLTLLLFVVVTYANPTVLWPGLGQGYPKAIAALGLGSLGVAALLYDRALCLGGRLGRWLGLYHLLLGLSSLWSLAPALSLTYFIEALKYFAIYLLLVNVADTPRRLAVLLQVWAWAGLFPALGALQSWSRGEHLVDGTRVAWVGIFANPNDLAYHLAIGCACALGALTLTRRPALRAAYLGLLAVLSAALLLTQSRGGVIAFGVVVGWFALRQSGRNTTVLVVFALAMSALVLAPQATRERTATTLAYETDASAQGRIDAWRTGWGVMCHRPLGGVGAGAFLLAWSEHAPGDVGPARAPHNTFVHVASETGLAGLVLFGGAFAFALGSAWRASPKASTLGIVARTVEIGLVGFLSSSTTGTRTLTWPLYLLLGLAAAVNQQQASPPAPPGGGRP